MAKPIALDVPPNNPQGELRSRLDSAPEEHAEALLAAYALLQELHDRGLLDLGRSALAAGDDLLDKLVRNVNSPPVMHAVRNLLFWRSMLGGIDPEWFKGIFEAIPDGISLATADRAKPVTMFGLLRRLTNPDSLRALAAGLDFLETFGRHLQTKQPAPRP